MLLATACRQVFRWFVFLLRPLWTALWLRPTAATHLRGTAADLLRSKPDLLIENALLRHQLVVLRRSSKRPVLTPVDRTLLVLLAGRLRTWRQALLIIKPDTVLGWHRAGYRLFWKRQSQPKPGRPPLTESTIALIREMAAANPLWGAERIRGELLKLDISVAKRTIEKYLRGARRPRPRGQTWTTFLRTLAKGIWACDFLHCNDLCFRSVFAFFIVEHACPGRKAHPCVFKLLGDTCDADRPAPASLVPARHTAQPPPAGPGCAAATPGAAVPH
jgi:hypothetical protein